MHKNVPTASIILAAYNGEKYIAEQIESIQRQSYIDFELLVCDDCSTDSTRDIVKKYEKSDQRIRLLVSASNGGLARNTQRGCFAATGRYIFFADQDDWWQPNKIETQVRYLDAHPDCYLVYHDSQIVDEKLNLLLPSFRRVLEGRWWSFCRSIVAKANLTTLLRANGVQGATVAIRRDLFDRALPIPASVLIPDAWFALIAAAQFRIQFLDMSLIRYRQHGKNVIGATVQGNAGHLANLFSNHFAKVSIKRADQKIAMFSEMRNRVDNPVSSIKIKRRIICMRSLSELLGANSFWQICWRAIRSFVIVCYAGRDSYHFFCFGYFLFNKMFVFVRRKSLCNDC